MVNLLLAIAIAAADTVRVPVTNSDTVDVEVHGSAGPAVVILPGMLGGTYSFRKVVDGLTAQGYRVYAMDLFSPESLEDAAGTSLEAQAARLTAVVDSMELRAPIVITHSIGGSVVYRAALLRPNLAGAIVAIEAGPAETANSPGVRNALRYSLLIRIVGVKRTLEKQLRDGLRKSAADPSWVTNELVSAYAQPFTENFDRTTRVFKSISQSKDPPLGSRLPELRTPVHLITVNGPRTGTVPEEEMARLRSVPNLQVHTVERTGSWVQEERPDFIVELIRSLRKH